MFTTPEIAMKYLSHGDQQIAELARAYLHLWGAVRDVYYSAHWTPDRSCNDVELWTVVRDAAGFPPGFSPKPISPLAVDPVKAVDVTIGSKTDGYL